MVIYVFLWWYSLNLCFVTRVQFLHTSFIVQLFLGNNKTCTRGGRDHLLSGLFDNLEAEIQLQTAPNLRKYWTLPGVKQWRMALDQSGSSFTPTWATRSFTPTWDTAQTFIFKKVTAEHFAVPYFVGQPTLHPIMSGEGIVKVTWIESFWWRFVVVNKSIFTNGEKDPYFSTGCFFSLGIP